MKKKDLVHIGTFGKVVGLKGHLKILMLTSDFDTFRSLKPFYNESGKNIIDFISLKINGKKLTGLLKDINSRNLAEAFQGKKIFSERKNLFKTKKKLFYVPDLINCEVRNQKKLLLGKVMNIKDFGAGNLLNVKSSQSKFFFIPMNDENIKKIDIKNKLIIVNPIKGILD